MISCRKIMFFLTENEQCNLLKEIEHKNEIYYVKCGNFDIDKVVRYNSIVNILPMISPTEGEHGYSSWLILPQNINVVAESAYILGQKKATVYPLHGNEKAIVYNPGGIYKESNVIYGEFYILSNNLEMIDVFKQIKADIKKISIKKDCYFIGKEIYDNKNNYDRLITISVKSPAEYDLKL